MSNTKIISYEKLGLIRKEHPRKTIVHCHGVFDLLHYGHLLHLQSAKKFGDLLVVTVTPDRFVNKGPGRPHHSEHKRAVMLAALEIVDYVAINRYARATEPIMALSPHFYVKGPEYRDKQLDITGGITQEEEAVELKGGKLVFTSDETESSTALLNQYFNRWDDAQKSAIDKIRSEVSLEKILAAIESFAGLRVLVVGEPIIDTYVFCHPESISTKNPSVSARYLYEENYAGGSLAISNHLSALGCKVSLLMTHGAEANFEKLLTSSLNENIKLEALVMRDIPTPRKTRHIVPLKTQCIFELINLRSDQWLHHDPDAFCKKLKAMSKDADLIIIADFGHGLFEGKILEFIEQIDKFIALNVQTNSGNFGFNPFFKHKRFDYLTIDERECRLATNNRFMPIEALFHKTFRERIKRPASITLGATGSIYFNRDAKEYRCPSFFREIIDTTGAGDAYFAITALLEKLKVKPAILPFIGNCYAGLKTRTIGNKSPVSKVDLIRTISSILK